jgi:hypothetical protein
MARISKVEMKYDASFDNIRGSPISIDSATVINEGGQIAQKGVTFTK